MKMQLSELKYGKKLPCTYADWEVTVWDDIFDINEFLTRKKVR